jgi:hypothetical protein
MKRALKSGWIEKIMLQPYRVGNVALFGRLTFTVRPLLIKWIHLDLSDAVDVYADWIDACETAKEAAARNRFDDEAGNENERQLIVPGSSGVRKIKQKREQSDSEEDEPESDEDYDESKSKKSGKEGGKKKKIELRVKDDFVADDDESDEVIESSEEEEPEDEAESTDDEVAETDEPVKKRRLVAAAEL